MTAVLVALIVLVGLVVALAAASVRVLREYERAVVFRLGRLIGQKGPGLVLLTPGIDRMVRVSLRTARMKTEIGADEAMDDETRKMVEAFFAGRGATVRFSGLEITDTNMDLSSDGRSAQQKIQFLDLLRGTADLPEEVYAVVQVAR